jgi:hypothetical protein
MLELQCLIAECEAAAGTAHAGRHAWAECAESIERACRTLRIVTAVVGSWCADFPFTCEASKHLSNQSNPVWCGRITIALTWPHENMAWPARLFSLTASSMHFHKYQSSWLLGRNVTAPPTALDPSSLTHRSAHSLHRYQSLDGSARTQRHRATNSLGPIITHSPLRSLIAQVSILRRICSDATSQRHQQPWTHHHSLTAPLTHCTGINP